MFHSKIYFSKKLNFSEDEASTEEERSSGLKERGKEKRENERSSSKIRETTSGFDRTHSTREKEDRKAIDEKRERLLPPPDVPPRWQQSQAHRPGFDQCQRDFSRKSASPASYDDEAWKDRRRGSDEVKMALQRANFLKQEEEKRYED